MSHLTPEWLAEIQKVYRLNPSFQLLVAHIEALERENERLYGVDAANQMMADMGMAAREALQENARLREENEGLKGSLAAAQTARDINHQAWCEAAVRLQADKEAVEKDNEELRREYERRGDVIVVWKMEAERLREKNERLRFSAEARGDNADIFAEKYLRLREALEGVRESIEIIRTYWPAGAAKDSFEGAFMGVSAKIDAALPTKKEGPTDAQG